MHAETATPVDEIRDAADLIRANVAEIARPDDRWTQSPGQQLHAGYTAHVAADGDPQWSGICDVIVGSGAEKHIAAADPTAMLAFADLLDAIADRYEADPLWSIGVVTYALTAARAYAGTPAAVSP